MLPLYLSPAHLSPPSRRSGLKCILDIDSPAVIRVSALAAEWIEMLPVTRSLILV